jgi:protein gp37
MRKYFSRDPRPYATPTWPLPNLWLGVTAENQKRADERIPTLLQIPAAKRFVSVEPMLEAVDLVAAGGLPAIGGTRLPAGGRPYLDWVIIGGETGSGARQMRAGWVRNLVTQCKSSSVSVFVKTYPVGKKLSKQTNQWPAYARLWQFP